MLLSTCVPLIIHRCKGRISQTTHTHTQTLCHACQREPNLRFPHYSFSCKPFFRRMAMQYAVPNHGVLLFFLADFWAILNGHWVSRRKKTCRIDAHLSELAELGGLPAFPSILIRRAPFDNVTMPLRSYCFLPVLFVCFFFGGLKINPLKHRTWPVEYTPITPRVSVEFHLQGTQGLFQRR